jgi:hypothetical protein
VPRLRWGWADGGYRGAFLAWALATVKIAFEVVARADLAVIQLLVGVIGAGIDPLAIKG